MINGPKLSFDDVYIIPKASELKSRSEVNLDIAYITKHSKKRLYGRPIMISNMDGIGTIEMAEAVYPQRIFTLLTKFEDRKHIANFLRNKESEYTFVSIGESNEDILSLKYIFSDSLYTPKILVDCANAYRYSFLDSIKRIRDLMPEAVIMAGNVCTPDGVENLVKAGSDIVRCGIANGCFVGNTLVRTSNGLKPIKDVKVGDNVLTHKNRYREVVGTKTKTGDNLYKINDQTCTGNHEFYVLHRRYVELVNEDNVHQYAEWIPAEKLTKDFLIISHETSE